MNRQYLDPIFLGRYPEELAGDLRRGVAAFPESDFDAIRAKIDFLGINYYTRGVMRHDDTDWLLQRDAGPAARRPAHTETEWEVYPAGSDGHPPMGLANDTGALRSTSPRTAPPSTIRRTRPERRSTIPCGSRISASTCAPRGKRSRTASICAATSPGRSSTTSSGVTDTRSGSGSSTSTTRRRSGPRKRAPASMRT